MSSSGWLPRFFGFGDYIAGDASIRSWVAFGIGINNGIVRTCEFFLFDVVEVEAEALAMTREMLVQEVFVGSGEIGYGTWRWRTSGK